MYFYIMYKYVHVDTGSNTWIGGRRAVDCTSKRCLGHFSKV